MKDLIEKVEDFTDKLKPRHDDDFVDRLYYFVTPTILTILAAFIGGKQFFGEPIQCWAPNEIARHHHWMEYAENLCFAENTYYVAQDEAFPMQWIERERREIHYYQWVSFILIGQALMLLSPKLIWNAFSWRSGFNVRSLIEQAQKTSSNGEMSGKEKASRELGNRIHQAILHQQRKAMDMNPMNKGDPHLPDYPNYLYVPTPSACYVTMHVLLFKLLNCCVVLVQLVFLTKFLEPAESDTTYWGFAVLQDLLAGRDWHQSGAFPRVTFCDFQIRQPTEHVPPLRYSFQCVLMLNMVNEKFFLFIWFWLLILLCIGIMNLLVWIYRALSQANAEEFVKTKLRFATQNMPKKRDLELFVRRGLCLDGVTVLRLIDMNCDQTVTSMLVYNLWTQYRKAVFIGQKKGELQIQKLNSAIERTIQQQQRTRPSRQQPSRIRPQCYVPTISSGNTTIPMASLAVVNHIMRARRNPEIQRQSANNGGEENAMTGRANPAAVQRPSPNNGMNQQMPRQLMRPQTLPRPQNLPPSNPRQCAAADASANANADGQQQPADQNMEMQMEMQIHPLQEMEIEAY